jgi:hypothetical protein
MSSKAFLLLFARLLMSSLFVWDGVVQLRNPGGTARYFASVHVPAPDIAVWISIPVHLFGGLALLRVFTADGPLRCLPLSAWAPLLVCICRPEIRTT